MPTLFHEAEGDIMGDDKREPSMNPAQSQTPGMLENSMHENRETPRVSGSNTPDRLVKATSYTTSAYASGESDSAVVPAKCLNNGAERPAEGMEGRALAKKNQRSAHTCRTQCRDSVSQGGRGCGRHLSAAIIQGKSRMR